MRQRSGGQAARLPGSRRARQALRGEQRGATRARRMIGVRDRRAERGEHAVAEQFVHGAARFEHGAAQHFEILVQARQHFLGRRAAPRAT